MNYKWFCLIFSFAVVTANNITEGTAAKHFEILSVEWDHVQGAYTVTLWILVAAIAKILFHVNKKFGDALPDSACLIVVGLFVGFVLVQFNVDRELFYLDATSFFLYLLPPIIFDAGYFMPNRQLFENFDSVMVFAFIGTIFNTLAIAGTLFYCGEWGLFSVEFTLFEILLFASLISAVDPVAVIAVFEEIHVNEFLFINVFGEALFNDGAAVVLYFLFKKFSYIGVENLVTSDCIYGGLSFFVITFGGIFIGLTFAVIVSFTTKYTDRVKILAPVLIFAFPYLAYLTAEMFGVSAIFSIIACGVAMKEYVKGNVTQEANTSVKYFVKLVALSSETVIFMFLGLSAVSTTPTWDTAFVVITIASCLVYRTIGVIIQCAILNRFRTKQFTKVDQFVLSYGGLRGAIAFGLAVSMPAIAAKHMFVTTTIAVIFFTVFVQGITIRPLLTWLNVERAEERQPTLVENVYNRYFDYIMTGIEDIAGQKGKHSLRQKYERFNAKVLKPVLMKSYEKRAFDATQIVRAYTKITLQEAMDLVCQGQKPNLPSTPKTKATFEYDTPSAPMAATPAAGVEMDALYRMFSQLLDRKIDEIRGAVKDEMVQEKPDGHDIADDYFGMMQSHTVSTPNLANDPVLIRRPKSENILGPSVNPNIIRKKYSNFESRRL